ncbi:sn-glycerol-3-phosphate dehydrogenase subunit C [Vulcanibacillus modesticaldus]|uniref:sn-glycerol-3-phosphate dehydrogenase subunit C n=1 Tax=Vulcanibacillus modesticaldus TaxID=337097 RepID=A0A1D2YUI7_9BACI|nr:anaerobic glycerol-3-phosphate dehydrogenase subunit C [Vulcanibacillus modesticaldus]OEF99372.1 sn-glycerol-3-phosphate dehydrogenase subunit C [Vulcanibacillus modesticaldus]
MLKLIESPFDRCLKCNACVVSCPVSNYSLDFGGPKHLGPELKRLIENQDLLDDPRVELCAICGNCDISCPEQVHVTDLIVQAKAIHSELSGTKFRDKLLSNPELIGKITSNLAPITNIAMKAKPIRKAIEKVMGIHSERQFPKYEFNNFNRRYKKKTANSERKVAYFVGCYATYNAPEIGDAFVEVMAYNNIEVAKPDQHCCGIPMLANGQFEQAKKNAKFNVQSLLKYVSEGYDIVATCSSCTLALKKEYVSVLGIDGAEELAKHVYDSSEYLRMLDEEGVLNKNLSPLNDNAGYYAPCHMKAQGIGNPAMDILELIPGYEIKDLAAGCCGQCGTFGFKEENFTLSLDIGKSMHDAVEELQPEYTVTECGMCKNQINQMTDQVVKHPIEVLAESYKKSK